MESAVKSSALAAVFIPFVTWLPSTLPRGWYIPKHIAAISSEIDLVRKGEVKRLRISMPPRHGKTETCTIRAAVRFLIDDPGQNILVTGYNQRYANRLSRKVRNLAIECGVKVARDKFAVDEWYTEQGGAVVARGVGSPPTGIGFNRIIIDDPVRDSKQVESETQRETINDWYLTDIYQRLEPDGTIILVMTQWSEYDLATVAIESEPDQWRSLVLPAEAAKNDPLGRAVGEALWKERFDEERLAQIRKVMASKNGPRMFEALFNCNPMPKEGNALKRSDFKIIEADQVPVGLRQYRAYDVAITTDEANDETVGTKGGMDEKGNIYLTDQEAWREEIPETFQNILEVAKKDGPDVGIGIERPLAGQPVMQLLKRAARAANLSIKKLEVRGRDKKVRMAPWAVKARQGQFFIVRGPWNEAFIEQCIHFTGKSGGKDDKVDSVSNLTELIALSSGERNEKDKPVEKDTYEYWQSIFGRSGD